MNSLPSWIDQIDLGRTWTTDEERMRFAIDLSRRNVDHGTGGPFGAAIFDLDSGRLLGIGVNRVIPNHDPTAHGEMIAFRSAGGFAENFSLREAGIRAGLYVSAEPCGMCLTATIWAGISHVFFGATTEDVEAIGFDEGIKPDDWASRLRRRGIGVTEALLREEAVAVLRRYRQTSGIIYNG